MLYYNRDIMVNEERITEYNTFNQNTLLHFIVAYEVVRIKSNKNGTN